MIIKLFEISKDFFDLMYSPFIEEVFENKVIRVKLDEEKACQEPSDDEDEPECDCNLCYVTREIILFINPEFYKKRISNKDD